MTVKVTQSRQKGKENTHWQAEINYPMYRIFVSEFENTCIHRMFMSGI